jgi:penicillin-binding protein 1A
MSFQRYSLPSDPAPSGAPPTRSDPPKSSQPGAVGSPGARVKAWLFWGALGLGLAFFLGLLGLGGAFYYYSHDLPRTDRLSQGYAPPQMTRILAREGTLIGAIFSERRTVVPLESLPDYVKTAFLAAEDAAFYEHRGLNYWGLLRAIVRNLKAGQVRQGGSTITQQVVKNVLLSQERTVERKMKETILAFRIERELSKDQILEMYLNHIYLGHGRYGVEEASRFLFAKHARELDIAEAATLAGIVAAPERYSPQKNAELAKKRRHYVLTQMRNKGFMTSEVFEEVDRTPLRVLPAAETQSDIAPEFVEEARKVLVERRGDDALRGGYTVTTTLDPELQAKAREAVRHGLDAYLKRQKLEPPFTLQKRLLWGKPHVGAVKRHHIYAGHVETLDDLKGTLTVSVGSARGQVNVFSEERFNPKHLKPSELFAPGALVRVRVLDDPKELGAEEPVGLALELGPEAALVAWDVATGDIRALVGSYEALPGGLDRATGARRQPGSSFKPILYAAALDTGKVTAASVFEFPPKEASVDGKEAPLERVTLRQGIAASDNRVAIETLHRITAAPVIDLARRLGWSGPLGEGDSLALGAYEASPLEMTRAFSAFATDGVLRAPRFVSKITSGGGDEIALLPQPEERVMRPEVAYVITHLLTSVVQEGTGLRASTLGRPLAGKTGTTNQAKDAWFVGFSTDLVVAVWVGYDDALPLGWGESGARSALPIWVEFMKAATAGKPSTDFPRPEGVIEAAIDPDTGLLARYGQANAKTEVFVRGTEPTEVAPEPPAAAPELPTTSPVETPDLEAPPSNDVVPEERGESQPVEDRPDADGSL